MNKKAVIEKFKNDISLKYKRYYTCINSGQLTPLEVIKLQENIFRTIEQLKKIPKESLKYKTFNVEFIITLFRMLVNNIVWKYVLTVDVITLINTMGDYKCDNYNSENIALYIDTCKTQLKENPNSYIVICDLCVGNILWGDLLINNGDTAYPVEIKRKSKKNDFIFKMIRNGHPDEGISKDDLNHYERILKQNQRNEMIKNALNDSPLYIDSDGGVAMPYCMCGISTFHDSFLNNVVESKEKLLHYYAVDDCINVSFVRRKKIQKLLGKYDSKEKDMQLIQKKPVRDFLIDAYKNRDNYISEQEGMFKILYNDVLKSAILPQPYEYGLDVETILDLMWGELEIYISINYTELFSKLRANGYKVYKKKRASGGVDFIHDGSRWVIERYGQVVYISEMLPRRISFGFYNSEGVLAYYDRIFEFFKMQNETNDDNNN